MKHRLLTFLEHIILSGCVVALLACQKSDSTIDGQNSQSNGSQSTRESRTNAGEAAFDAQLDLIEAGEHLASDPQITIADLASRLNSDSPKERLTAIYAIQSRQTSNSPIEKALKKLDQLAREDVVPQIRANSFRVLLAVPTTAEDALRRGLGDKDREVRRHILQAVKYGVYVGPNASTILQVYRERETDPELRTLSETAKRATQE